MKLSDFDYNLPEELIAQSPMEPRDHSRLLVLDKKSGEISHHTFYEITNYLHAGDILVVNNSKVFPARLFGKRADTGGKVEILLNKNITPIISSSVISAPHSVIPAEAGIQDSNLLVDSRLRGNDNESSVWEVIGKNLKLNKKIVFDGSKLEAVVLEKNEKLSLIKFNISGEDFFSEVEKIGHTPLPPYIKKDDTAKDKVDYQTVYAKPIGSAAAPTAGLHFTKEILDTLKEKGVEIAEVTLHVGLGTFAPVEAENIEDHQIHHEYYNVAPSEIKKIVNAKKEGCRVIAVGTTSTRVLETIFNKGCHPRLDRGSNIVDLLVDSRFHGNDDLLSGWTNIFIYPGYQFKCIDGLITNFHLPKSSLLMLISALVGKYKIDRAYQEAIKNKYRFFSYGDAMLII